MKSDRLFTLFIMLTLLLVTACQGNETREDEPSEHNNFLWEVKSETGTVYLLGSIHMAKEELYPLDIVIERRFRDSDYLVVEADVSGVNMGQMMKFMQEEGRYGKDKTIVDVISEELWAKVEAEFKEAGMHPAMFKSFKPWALALTIVGLKMQSAGYSADKGIDKHFLDKAKGWDKPILELESVEYQLEMLTSMSEELQILFLESVFSELAGGTEEWTAKLFEYWEVGNYEAVEEMVISSQEKYPELEPFHNLFYTERNYKMTEKVEGYLKDSKTYFVVAGAAHMVGEEGIIELLRARGYEVKQL